MNNIINQLQKRATAFNSTCYWKGGLNLIALLLLAVNASATTETDSLPIDKLIDAPEIEAVLSPSVQGRLFTLIDTLEFAGKNSIVFFVPNTTTPAELSVKSHGVPHKSGTAYVVTDVKRIVRVQNQKKYLVAMLELHRLVNNEVSKEVEDRIVYKVSFDITGVEVYDEEDFVCVLGVYFNSVAMQLRRGAYYSGKAQLEGSPKGLQNMINLIGVDWMISGKTHKGLIEKEKAKEDADTDLYVLKFNSPLAVKNGDKFHPTFGRSDDLGSLFYDFNPIVMDSLSVSVDGIFHHFEVRVLNLK